MSEYYVTFGQKYRYEPHPMLWQGYGGRVPDGWVRIEAPDEPTARGVASILLGEAWACIYAADDFGPDLYPLGEMRLWGPDIREATP